MPTEGDRIATLPTSALRQHIQEKYWKIMVDVKRCVKNINMLSVKNLGKVYVKGGCSLRVSPPAFLPTNGTFLILIASDSRINFSAGWLHDILLPKPNKVIQCPKLCNIATGDS